MPIPKPGKNEKENAFIGRCMGNSVMKTDYPKNKRRLAVCYSSWRVQEVKKEIIMAVKDVVKKVRRMLSESKVVKSPKFCVGHIVISEAFLSLRGALDKAVIAKFGKESYVSDFSNREVIVGFNREAAMGPSYETKKYAKVPYKMTRNEVTFTGDEKTVEQKTTYENKLEVSVLADLVIMDSQFSKEKKDG